MNISANGLMKMMNDDGFFDQMEKRMKMITTDDIKLIFNGTRYGKTTESVKALEKEFARLRNIESIVRKLLIHFQTTESTNPNIEIGGQLFEDLFKALENE